MTMRRVPETCRRPRPAFDRTLSMRITQPAARPSLNWIEHQNSDLRVESLSPSGRASFSAIGGSLSFAILHSTFFILHLGFDEDVSPLTGLFKSQRSPIPRADVRDYIYVAAPRLVLP